MAASENGLCAAPFPVVVVVAAVVVVVVKGIPVAKMCSRGPVNVKRNHIIHSMIEKSFPLWRHYSIQDVDQTFKYK